MRDLVIIGAGPGGFDTAIYAKQHGLDVVLIEANTVGGTCLNWGCIPTKALYHNATQWNHVKNLQHFGIQVADASLDMDIVKQRKEAIVSAQVQHIHTSLKRLKIELIEGFATIRSPNQVVVNNQTIDTKHIIIATGSSVRRIPFTGDALPIVHDSKGLLTLDPIPKQLLVIGAGVIGCEMASIFQAFGSTVTMIEYLDEILPGLDKDLRRRARNLYKRHGLSIHTKSTIKELTESKGQYNAIVTTKKGDISLDVDYVLVATGRQPYFGGIDLDNLGIEYTKQGITVNQNKQTSIPSIYAIGDVNGEMMLAHKATYDGYKAVSHIIGMEIPIDFNLVPSVVFSIPEMASVGVTEQQLQHIDYKTSKYLYKTNAKAQCMNETDGFVKLIAVDDKLVGGHIIGAHASDLIHEIAILIHQKVPIHTAHAMIHAHPTLSELVGECIKGFNE